MNLDHQAIAARIPHRGAMNLLERVVSWDAQHIHCQAISHRDQANPLARNGSLPATAGIEYAAQAMAVHGALRAGCTEPPQVGYLTSLRSVSLHVARLDDQAPILEVEAEQISADSRFVLYSFSVSAAGHRLLQGRASIILNGEDLPLFQETAS